jgi:heme-degrading monooxygenase HmoA
MFIRTIYATGDPAKLDSTVEALNTEGRKLVAEQPGYRGFGLFVNREIGTLVTGTWWESEQARQNADERLREPRAAMFEPFVSTVAVSNYEAAALHRRQQPGPEATIRLTRFELAPSDADLLIETFQTTTLPRLDTIDGLIGATLFVDRSGGRGSVGTMFADRAALVASRSSQAAARQDSVAKTHVTVFSLEELDVVFADVRPA